MSVDNDNKSQRGTFVPDAIKAILPREHVARNLLAQLLYWYKPSRKGAAKFRGQVRKSTVDGLKRRYYMSTAVDWQKTLDCTRWQYEQAGKLLVAKGFIDKRIILYAKIGDEPRTWTGLHPERPALLAALAAVGEDLDLSYLSGPGMQETCNPGTQVLSYPGTQVLGTPGMPDTGKQSETSSENLVFTGSFAPEEEQEQENQEEQFQKGVEEKVAVPAPLAVSDPLDDFMNPSLPKPKDGVREPLEVWNLWRAYVKHWHGIDTKQWEPPLFGILVAINVHFGPKTARALWWLARLWSSPVFPDYLKKNYGLGQTPPPVPDLDWVWKHHDQASSFVEQAELVEKKLAKIALAEAVAV